ncbi:MAG: hypothetical protein P8N02_09905 [Actinomycetota bacterium]|nr:hypothetical protein [Actinomycetota bacterium]
MTTEHVTSAPDVDLSTGWVTSDIDLQGELAAHPDLGVALVGSIGEFPPQSPPAWYSATGEVFSEVGFPAPTGDPIGAHDVAANENGFVAILFNSVFASFSPDGQTWEPIDLTGLVGGCGLSVVDQDVSTPGNSCGLVDVAAGPAGFVILGADGDRCVGFAVHSPDGREWAVTDFPQNCAPIGAASSSQGFTALGLPNLVLSSPDGVSWDTVTATGLPDLRDRIWQFSARGDTLVLVGTQSGPNCDYIAGTWYSTDGGSTWAQGTIDPVGTPAPDDAGFQPEDIEVTDYGFVAVGPLVSDPLCRPAEEPEDLGLILVSGDGITWHQHATEFALRNIAVTQDGLIGSGILGIATWTPTD